mmetsp:Transcript_44650/g.45300  ORF Transcript_44650/g.45300 Transcript_44650/m.45300 type:complete len:103 (+) Transcript_44650:185-493(+)
MIEYMHYTELATDQSNEINFPTFWSYYDPHGNTTRMSNDPRLTKKMKTTTPVTIAPAKASLKKNQQEGRKEIQPMVGHTKITEMVSEDIGGDTRRRREGIQV